MEFQGFSVIIAEGKESKGGYIELGHNTRYTLSLGNHKSLRCDARVEIDGKLVGIWRINAKSEIRLERPVDDDGHFTLYVLGTAESKQAGLVLNEQTGLVCVIFTPEKDRRDDMDIPVFQRRRIGGTGLSGHSKQVFTEAAPIDYDEDARVVINLRLVGVEDSTPRPLRGIAMQTPVPPLPR